jgi:predicted DNA-binding protein
MKNEQESTLPKTKLFSFRAAPDLAEDLEKAVRVTGLTATQIITEAVERELEQIVRRELTKRETETRSLLESVAQRRARLRPAIAQVKDRNARTRRAGAARRVLQPA